MQYVIIGNSIAAACAISGIRETDLEGKITVVSSEPYHVYSKPLISYMLLGKVDKEKMKFRDSDFYTTNNVDVLYGKTAISIDEKRKLLTIDDGTSLKYDKLLIATGSSPIVPPIPGLDGIKNKFTFMTIDDAENLKKSINKNSRVLILGAGLIGLKCAEGIRKHVKSVTVVDKLPRILSSILDNESAFIMQKFLEKNGIRFILNEGVNKFDSTFAYTDSSKIEFDCLVLAVGVKPNVELIKNIDGKVGRGITVDKKMQTSIPDIYAAGDCIELFDVSSNQTKVLALLPNAHIGGECAGINMAGGEKTFQKAIPMNAIGFWGKHIITAGTYIGQSITINNSDDNYKKIYYKDNKMCGYILIGEIDKAGIYTSLIRECTPLDEIDFDLVCQKPSLLAFSKQERNKKIGGAK